MTTVGETEAGSDSESGTSGTSAETDDGPDAPLVADAGESRYALVGEDVVLDGSASTGAVSYAWDPGDGSGPTVASSDSVLVVRYSEPGRYRPVLTVLDSAGNSRSAQVTITVTHVPTHEPRHTTTIARVDDERFFVVSPDADELTMIAAHDGEFSVVDRWSTCVGPRTVAVADSEVAVACQGDDAVMLVDPQTGASRAVALPRAVRPYGVLAVGSRIWVTLQATGELAEIDPSPADPELVARHDVISDARGMGVLPDGRIAVTRWRSLDSHAEIALFDPETGQVEPVGLAFDDRPSSDTEAGGIPSYLDAVVVSPTADWAAIPSLQANIGEGEHRSGTPLTFQSTVRGVVSLLDLGGTSPFERFEQRKHFDDRGFMAAAVYSSRGDYLYLVARGARTIERLDTFNRAQSGAILDVGYAPCGLVVTSDDAFLLVDAALSREVVVFDITDFGAPIEVARLPIVGEEPLSPAILRGKQLFNDSLDPRLARDAYVACAHCHLDGESDRRVWDFTDRGEGLRNTISLLGRGGPDYGPIHWSANFDEIQDFEHDIRAAAGGSGLLADSDWSTGTRSEPLGDPKAGISEDLDALAAYVHSLDAFAPSPWREPGGELGEAAEAGRILFESEETGCTQCHTGPALTDSAFLEGGAPLLHDVGTLGPGSGNRLGGPLPGLDTPTLHGLWNDPPYLHDGSAATIRDVLTIANPGDRHGVTRHLSEGEIDQLVAYLLGL
jgi:PKD repeat protein